jgi:hypothetical protein
MSMVFGVLLAVHGLIHLVGLTRPNAVLWGAAAASFLATAVTLFLWPRWWWAVGAVAVAVSTIPIAQNWSEARAGAAVNAVVLTGVVFGFLAQGPFSLRAQYDRDVRRWRDRPARADILRDADLAGLPAPVRRYLRRAGVIGQPPVRSFRARMHGRIRSGPDASWMPIAAEQLNVVDVPVRLFYLTGQMRGIPVQGFHRFVSSSASMIVKAAALVPVARASGPEMDRSETVTMFNDMCLMAPAALAGTGIEWTPVDDRRARARFSGGNHTIAAELVFNEEDELVNFLSDDRSVVEGGGPGRRIRWSTPVGSYRTFGQVRVASHGTARWHEPAGEYAYIELTIDDIQYNR